MRRTYKGLLFCALAALFWSGSGVLGKYTTWSGIATAGGRSLFALIIMAIARGGIKVKLTKGNITGALGVALTSVLFMAANKLTTAANAIVIQYAMTAFVIIFCWVFYREKPNARTVICTAFVMGGVFLCSLDGMGGGKMLGNIFALITAVTFALVFFCSRMEGANAQDYSFLGVAVCVPLLIYGFWDEGCTFTLPNVLSQIGMGVCLAGGYTFMSIGMRYASPVSAAITANIEPILNPLWVFLFLGERPAPIALIGAAVVLITVTVYSITGIKYGGAQK